jgi:hypothetical protein
MMLKSIAAALLATLLLAGCTGGSDDPADKVPALEVTTTTGGIRGVVVDETIKPIAEAKVTISGVMQPLTTDAAGIFSISGLEAGSYLVKASHPFYDEVQQTVDVVAGVADPPAVKLLLTRVVFENPYLQTLKYDGFVVCSTNVVTPFGALLSEECGEVVGVDCVVPVVGCTRVGGQGNNEVQFDFTIGAGTKSVVIEQVWEPTSEAGTGFYSPVSTEWSCLPVCSGNRMIELQGSSPLRGVLDEAMLADFEIVPDSTIISIFTWADPGNQASPASVLLNQPFQNFVTTFHYLPAPEGWSLVAGSPNPF